MKTKDFIVEYKGIGEDAESMGADHEVQLARQDCYHAAKDAIALHHLLKNISEEQGLESWMSEKITLAADYLKSVVEHFESQEEPAEEETILSAFNFEEAEQQFETLVNEERLDELGNEVSTKSRIGGMGYNVGQKTTIGDPGRKRAGIPYKPAPVAQPFEYPEGTSLADIKADLMSKSQALWATISGGNYGPNTQRQIATTKGQIKATKEKYQIESKKLNSIGQRLDELNSATYDSDPANDKPETAAQRLKQQYLVKRKKAEDEKETEIKAKEREKEVTEGNNLHEEEESSNPMVNAVLGRFTRSPAGHEAISKYGIESVLDAVDEACMYWEGEEIGSSDISIYFKYTLDHLREREEAMALHQEFKRMESTSKAGKRKVNELSNTFHKNYIHGANVSRDQATADMHAKGYDPKIVDKMDRRAEFTMRSKNKIASRGANVSPREIEKEDGERHEYVGNHQKKLVTPKDDAARAKANKERMAKAKPVKESATGGASSAGGFASGPVGKGGKPGTGIPKGVGNKVVRRKVTVGKGVY